MGMVSFFGGGSPENWPANYVWETTDSPNGHTMNSSSLAWSREVKVCEDVTNSLDVG